MVIFQVLQGIDYHLNLLLTTRGRFNEAALSFWTLSLALFVAPRSAISEFAARGKHAICVAAAASSLKQETSHVPATTRVRPSPVPRARPYGRKQRSIYFSEFTLLYGREEEPAHLEPATSRDSLTELSGFSGCREAHLSRSAVLVQLL